MDKEEKNWLEKYGVSFAIALVVFGIFIIILFMCRTPFNDWSGETDPTLFGQYGDFIGGFIGTFFSLAGFFLLYNTLIAQQRTIKNQEKDSLLQKKAIERERFETTFFNLLNVQQNITDKIKAYLRTLEEVGDEKVFVVAGREFFLYARNELAKINESVFSDSYLGGYNKYDEEYIEHLIGEIEDSQNPDYINQEEAEKEVNGINHELGIKYANTFYGISNKHWESTTKKEKSVKIKYVYYFFFKKFHYSIGHYFRNLYNILKFIETYEENRKNASELQEHQSIVEDCKQYAQFIQAQMSSYELALLYYNALCFPKSLRLIQKYNLLENLAVEDLIDKNHYDESKMKLKSRPKLFTDI